jgi:hypothetical protein
MPLIRPRFIALDSSQLGGLAADMRSRDERRREAAMAFMNLFSASGGVILLCWHHFEELLRYRDEAAVAERVAFFRSLPVVAWIASAVADNTPGAITDILTFEAAEAFKAPDMDAAAIRDRVAPGLFRCGTGHEAIQPFMDHFGKLQIAFWQSEERSRAIVSIAGSNYIDVGKTRVIDWRNGRWRSKEDAERRLASMGAILTEDIQKHGDKRIDDPAYVVAQFLDGVRLQAEAAQARDIQACDAVMLAEGVDWSDIEPETTIDEMTNLASFRRRLRLVNDKLGFPWAEFKRRVGERRVPSGLVQWALRRYAQDLPERKGSELIDRYLACLAPYADITYVDKRTHENIKRARQSSPEFAAVIRRIEKARGYEAIERELSATRR